MNISIVIPNYNGENLLKENLPKIFEYSSQYKKGQVQIIVTDDFSRDNSVEFLRGLVKNAKKQNVELKIIENRQNRGFSSNVNSGVRNARGEIVILLNTDVTPHKDFLIPLLENFKKKNIFAVGCMDESIENGKTVLRGRGSGKWTRGFLVHFADNVKNGKTTLWASGGSSAFRKEIWDRIGGLNEIYDPFYWEDIDISYRAQKIGYSVIFEPKSKVIHKHSLGSIQTQNSKSRIKRIAYRNQFLFVWLNATDLNLLISHFFWLPFHIFIALKDSDFSFILGFIDALLKLRKVLFFRSVYTKLFTKTDDFVVNRK